MNYTKHTIALSFAAALMSYSGLAHNTRNHSTATPVTVAREAQPGDDHRGKGKPLTLAREAQPGDDHRGKGKPLTLARETQPGDDRGGRGEPQPGDDRGRNRGRGTPRAV